MALPPVLGFRIHPESAEFDEHHRNDQDDQELKDVLAELRELLDDGLGDQLDVTYILATDPNLELRGKVKEIQLNAETHDEEGNTVLVKVEINRWQLPHMHRGVGVTANVYCGRRPIGYVWFHDLIAFIQSRILFRYF